MSRPAREHLPRRIETERLTLRAWAPEDAAELQMALTESVEHLVRWIPWATPEPPTPERTLALLEKWTSDFEAGESFVYAVVDRASAELIGGAGLYPRVGPGGLEVGYWIRLHRSGEGYATEASGALTRVGLAVPGIDRIEIHCDPENLPSRRIPEKLGYALRSEPEDGPAGEETRGTVVYVLEPGTAPI